MCVHAKPATARPMRASLSSRLLYSSCALSSCCSACLRWLSQIRARSTRPVSDEHFGCMWRPSSSLLSPRQRHGALRWCSDMDRVALFMAADQHCACAGARNPAGVRLGWACLLVVPTVWIDKCLLPPERHVSLDVDNWCFYRRRRRRRRRHHHHHLCRRREQQWQSISDDETWPMQRPKAPPTQEKQRTLSRCHELPGRSGVRY